MILVFVYVFKGHTKVLNGLFSSQQQQSKKSFGTFNNNNNNNKKKKKKIIIIIIYSLIYNGRIKTFGPY